MICWVGRREGRFSMTGWWNSQVRIHLGPQNLKNRRRRINRAKMSEFMRFGSRTTVFTSGEGNGLNSGDFCSVKILRHRRGSNTRSSLYESDALPLGHCALGLTRNFIDSIVQTIVMTSALFERSNQEALLLSRVCFLWFLWDRQGAVAKW